MNRLTTRTSRASKNYCAFKYNNAKQREFCQNRFLIGQTNLPNLPFSKQPRDTNLNMRERPQWHNSNALSIFVALLVFHSVHSLSDSN